MKKLLLAVTVLSVFSFQAISQNVGIGTPTPASKAAVSGNLSVGSGYTGTAAPTDGAIIEGKVGIGTSSPDASTVLDVTSTNKGVSFPNVNLLSANDATTIPNPKKGLVIYNTGATLAPAGLYTNTGTSGAPNWQKLSDASGTVSSISVSSPLTTTGGANPTIGLGVVPVDKGGTGLTAIGAGQIAIGNGSNTYLNTTISSGTGINVVSAAGSITVNNTGDTDAGDDVTTASTAGGDVNGTFSNLQINSGAVGSTEIADGSVAAVDLNQMGASNGQVIQWNGTAWVPTTPTGGTITGASTTNYVPKWTTTSPTTGTLSSTSSIFDNGNVGVGTSAPQHQLSVGDATTDGQLVTLRGYSNTPGSWKGGAAFGYTTASVIMGELGGVAHIGGHNSTLTAWANLAINSGAGNVGIGNSAPAYKLDVTGETRSTGSIYTGGHFVIQAADPYLRTDADNKHMVVSGGSGWTATGATMVLRGASASNNAHGLELYTGNAERARILSNGNFGIGATAPSERLDVTGNIKATGIVYWGNSLARTEYRDNAGLRGDAGARSGFFETSTPTNYPAGASSWWHLLDVRHNNPANNFAMQFAGSFYDQNLWFRKTNDNPAQAWVRVLTTNDIPGGTLPAGSTGQTLYHNGASWVASASPIYNDGTQTILGGFSTADADEWPRVTWLRTGGYDDGLIKGNSTRGVFGRPGFGIHMSSDKHWGFWSSGWDPLVDIEGGSGRMYVKGNVGMGVSNPASKLHVMGKINLHQSGADGGQNRFEGIDAPTSANGRAQFVMSSAYSDLVIASSQANPSHGSTLTFATYNPADANDYRKFVVNQGNWGARAQFLDFGYAANIPNPHSAINSGSTTLTIDGSNRYVGVGIMNPNAKLDVSTGSDGIAMGQIHGDNTNTIQTYIDGHWADRTTYASGCCNKLLLQPDIGEVGIRTTGPTAVLDVNGSTRIRSLTAGLVKSDASGNLSIAGGGDIPGGSGSYIQNQYGGAQSAEFWVSGRGRVDGSLFVSQNNATGGGIVLADDGDIVDNNDGWASHRFSYGIRVMNGNGGAGTGVGAQISGNGSNPSYFNAGKVGIGTTAPLGKLHVAGGHANGIMEDGSDRPSVGVTGVYPQMVMMSGNSGNGNHGASFMLGGYDAGASGNHKHWAIGTSGQNSTFLDIGYHNGTDLNPHAGIRNYNGSTFMTITDGGNVGIGTLSPNTRLVVTPPSGNVAAAIIRSSGGQAWGTVLTVATDGGNDEARINFSYRGGAKTWQIGGYSNVNRWGIWEDGGDGVYGSGWGTERFTIFPGGGRMSGYRYRSTGDWDQADLVLERSGALDYYPSISFHNPGQTAPQWFGSYSPDRLNAGNCCGGGWVTVAASGFTTISDITMKKEIVELHDQDLLSSLASIRSINSIRYKYNNEITGEPEPYSGNLKRVNPHLGFSAQSLPAEVVVSDLTKSAASSNQGYILGYSLNDMDGLLVAGVKALDKNQTTQNEKLQQIQKKLEEQNAVIEQMKKELEELKKNK